jgi:hypothetical protein
MRRAAPHRSPVSSSTPTVDATLPILDALVRAKASAILTAEHHRVRE